MEVLLADERDDACWKQVIDSLCKVCEKGDGISCSGNCKTCMAEAPEERGDQQALKQESEKESDHQVSHTMWFEIGCFTLNEFE